MTYVFRLLLLSLMLTALCGCEGMLRARDLKATVPITAPSVVTEDGKVCVNQCRLESETCAERCRITNADFPCAAPDRDNWSPGYTDEDCGELCDNQCNYLLSLCYGNCK